MKRKVLIITNVILAVMLALLAVGYTYAWFAEYYKTDITLYAEPETGYFASGSGTSDDPYIITKSRHLYNLAWLQNTGKFSTTTTYFELGDDIDMSSTDTYFVIPPIGNDKYPFSGSFDGNGHTISGLIVSTDKTKLTNFPNESASSYTFSKYVGFFGNTGSGSTITNFILDNPVVEVSSSNTSYGSSSESCVGLAIGYVNGKASTIGVIGGILAVQPTGYTTYNSILGTISESLGTSVTGGSITVGGTTSGTDLGYGTSTDIQELHETLTASSETKDGTTGDVKKSYALPFRTDDDTFVDSENLASGGSADTATVTLSSGSKTVDVARTQKASSKGNNIGYYVGSDMKTYNELSSGQTVEEFYNTYYSTFYYPNHSSDSYVCGVDTDVNGDVYPEPSDDIKEYLSEYGNYFIRLTGSEIDINNEGGLVYVDSEYGQVGLYSGGVLLPRRCIWVAPVEAGTIKIVAVAVGSESTMGLRVNKLTRSTPGDYSTYFTSYTNELEFNAILLKGKAYYFEIEVTENDIKAGYEYAITGGNTYKTYISYIDLGTTGGTTSLSDSDGKYSGEYDVSAIDFIYGGVTIYGSNFVILNSGADSSSATLVAGEDYEYYVPTETRIGLTSVSTGTSAVLIIAYTRKSEGTEEINSASYTIRVTYYTTGTDVPTSTTTANAYIILDAADSTYFDSYNDMVNSFE